MNGAERVESRGPASSEPAQREVRQRRLWESEPAEREAEVARELPFGPSSARCLTAGIITSTQGSRRVRCAYVDRLKHQANRS